MYQYCGQAQQSQPAGRATIPCQVPRVAPFDEYTNMEEYDDLASGPTEDGSIDLSHNTWKTLPPELNDFSMRLLHLEMSNNRLTSIPESIGNLVLLQTLDVSFNRIEDIDGGIGKCLRLRRINLEKNRLEALPVEIGKCLLLVSNSKAL